MILCLMLMLSLATTAFADDATPADVKSNISFTGGATGATYSAFRLLNSTDGGDGKYAYTLNEKYTAILQEVTGKTTQEDIVDAISKLTDVNAFAETVYEKIVENQIVADYTTDSDSIASADQGYYLIAETALGSYDDGTTDTYSLIMLDTLGDTDITVKTKESYPTVDKTVEEKNDSRVTSSWGEHADYDIGDTINFQIVGTVSGQYENYKTYYYSFKDTMDAGLTLDASSIKVTIGSTDVTEHFDIEATDSGFTATADLKDVEADAPIDILHNSRIVVTYTATLNENALSGTPGNINRVVLEYQNNPYSEEEGVPEHPGKTPEDVTIVFTYDAIINKTDKNGNALEGAGFTLYKFINTDNKWIQVGNEITGVTTFNFEGLDVGQYKLEETTVPEGYNKADDIEFRIEAVYDTTKDPVVLTELKVLDKNGDPMYDTSAPTEIETIANDASFTINLGEGTLTTDVVNNAGVELPSTGGMGTTLIYIMGGAMVLAAVILLVTKKRMASAE